MRVFKALIISLLVYALFIWLYLTQFSNIKKFPTKLNNHVIKIDIHNIPIPAKVIAPIVKAKPKSQIVPIQEVMPMVKVEKKKIVKKKVLVKKKKIVKKKKLVKKKKVVKKKVIKKKKIVKKKKVVKKKPIKKKIIVKKKPSPKKVYVPKKLVKKKEVVKKSKELEAFESEMVYIPELMIKPRTVQPESNDLASFLSTPSTPVSAPWSYPNNKIRKLYGSGFHKFTPTQKKFIENNLNTIQEITQRTLTRRGYPQGAGETGQEGTNVVSFNLHPNGDISNLRLKTRIGYRSLDDNTLSLIRVAYMDYPYPSTTTKIIFYVTYSIYGY